MTLTTATLLGALLLLLVHVAAPWLRFLGGTPRSVWLSLAGGVSVAYVFVHLLPELAEGQRHVSRAVDGEGGAESGGLLTLGFAERHVYVIALVGLAVFYGLDKVARSSRVGHAAGTASDAPGRGPREKSDPGEDMASSGAVFWIHMGSFGLYNVLIGYLLLHREPSDAAGLVFFAVAMALHFLVTDFDLHAYHRHRYRGVGRWLLVLALAAGVALGAGTALSRATLAVLVAFLAGGVILNVLKEEVPDERQSRFWAFAGGMAGYTALLLAL